MASMLDIDPNDLDEEHRHMQIASVLDGMDDEEDAHHQEHNQEQSDYESDNEENHYDSDNCMLKMLVTDNAAGAIIGKSGKAIADLQAESNARIKVSQAADFYPGTNERTILLSGPMDTVVFGQELIWDKVAQFSKPRITNRAPPSFQESSDSTITGKLLIPNEAGGLIIGRGGVTIKAIQEQSGARVQISPKDDLNSKISKERVLILSGTKEACTECTELILVKLHEDANVAYQNKNTSYSRNFNMKHNGSMSQQQVSPAMRMALPQGAETTSETSTITINVPDSIVGFILGKRGSVIAEIQKLSSAKVVVSPRKPREEIDEDDEVAIRVVTITGSPSAAQMAQFMITQKLHLANAAQESAAAEQRQL